MAKEPTFTAFAGNARIANGELVTMLIQTKARLDAGEPEQVLIFDDRTGRQIDFDFRGSIGDVMARLPDHPLYETMQAAEQQRSGPGRPKLGVVSKEITLLPRHWEWLAGQRGGISASLRRIVEAEMKRNPGEQAVRRAVEAAGNFMSAIAGDLPDYEEATRALFAHDGPRLAALIADWPADIREHVARLVSEAVPF